MGSRLNVNINSETRAALEEMAAEKKLSVTEVVRRAVSIMKFLEDELGEGDKVLQVFDKETKEKTTLALL